MSRLRLGVILAITAAALCAYGNSFSGPFVFDDLPSIVNNASVRHLWPPWGPLHPPADNTAAGRPLLNLSLAINYALGGTRVGGYHLVNLALHVAAALALFGLVRRTRRAAEPERTLWAGAAGLLWAAHPLATVAVTYVVQRAEALMAFLYLLALYTFVRGARRGCVLCCALGMAAKETMVTAPLVILLYDRVFVAASWRELWARRRGFYAALAATWLVLAVCVALEGSRNGSVGFDLITPWWRYPVFQLHALAVYLRLAFWPHPLVFFYGMATTASAASLMLGGCLCAALASVALSGLRRPTAAAFLAASFLLVLAPTSSLLPISSETMAEQRMYLPLAAAVVAFVLVLRRLLPRAGLAVIAVLALAEIPATRARNRVYQDEIVLWQDTLARTPDNFIAHNDLGVVYNRVGRPADARAEYDRALAIRPSYRDAWINRGDLSEQAGDLDGAESDYEHALATEPGFPITVGRLAVVQFDRGNGLRAAGRIGEAMDAYRAALKLDPKLADADFNLANLCLQYGVPAQAIPCYEETLRLRPAYPDAQHNLDLARRAAALSAHP